MGNSKESETPNFLQNENDLASKETESTGRKSRIDFTPMISKARRLISRSPLRLPNRNRKMKITDTAYGTKKTSEQSRFGQIPKGNQSFKKKDGRQRKSRQKTMKKKHIQCPLFSCFADCKISTSDNEKQNGGITNTIIFDSNKCKGSKQDDEHKACVKKIWMATLYSCVSSPKDFIGEVDCVEGSTENSQSPTGVFYSDHTVKTPSPILSPPLLRADSSDSVLWTEASWNHSNDKREVTIQPSPSSTISTPSTERLSVSDIHLEQSLDPNKGSVIYTTTQKLAALQNEVENTIDILGPVIKEAATRITTERDELFARCLELEATTDILFPRLHTSLEGKGTLQGKFLKNISQRIRKTAKGFSPHKKIDVKTSNSMMILSALAEVQHTPLNRIVSAGNVSVKIVTEERQLGSENQNNGSLVDVNKSSLQSQTFSHNEEERLPLPELTAEGISQNKASHQPKFTKTFGKLRNGWKKIKAWF